MPHTWSLAAVTFLCDLVHYTIAPLLRGAHEKNTVSCSGRGDLCVVLGSTAGSQQVLYSNSALRDTGTLSGPSHRLVMYLKVFVIHHCSGIYSARFCTSQSGWACCTNAASLLCAQGSLLQITQSQNHVGWKRTPKSSSPIINSAPLCSPLNHILKWNSYTFSECFQGLVTPGLSWAACSRAWQPFRWRNYS